MIPASRIDEAEEKEEDDEVVQDDEPHHHILQIGEGAGPDKTPSFEAGVVHLAVGEETPEVSDPVAISGEGEHSDYYRHYVANR